ncbi:MAG TPA: type I-C CRISPR-associated protein Cas7/Csd2 [Anaerolineaceae bacterium]|nr:type I-C CRISPR-associated protein Cas7/Csd2 [Anaerolineaceae bacterium]
METLKNKIDFAVIVNVKNANPNGDPLNGNRPRVNYDGYGELSDVCIKRKIRNRLMETGYSIFVQSDDNRMDDYRNLRSRAEGVLKNVDMKNDKKYRDAACKQWIDVRTFGQVFAFSGKKGKAGEKDSENGEGTGVSIGIRGPVSIHSAFSVAPVLDRISSIQITKSVSGEGDGTKRASDTMGMKHRVDHGAYVFYGSMSPQLATKTGFSDEDAEAIKKTLITLFRNDASSARPEGSMEIYKVYWWKHNSKNGQYSSAKVHRSVEKRIRVKDGIDEPRSIDDYEIPGKEEIEKQLPGLECEVLDGE